MDEDFRIRFVEQRDGKEAALKFAEQTLAAYTKAATDPKRCIYGDSITYLIEYLRQNGYSVRFVVIEKIGA